jgi:hypothetical protein
MATDFTPLQNSASNLNKSFKRLDQHINTIKDIENANDMADTMFKADEASQELLVEISNQGDEFGSEELVTALERVNEIYDSNSLSIRDPEAQLRFREQMRSKSAAIQNTLTGFTRENAQGKGRNAILKNINSMHSSVFHNESQVNFQLNRLKEIEDTMTSSHAVQIGDSLEDFQPFTAEQSREILDKEYVNIVGSAFNGALNRDDVALAESLLEKHEKKISDVAGPDTINKMHSLLKKAKISLEASRAASNSAFQFRNAVEAHDRINKGEMNVYDIVEGVEAGKFTPGAGNTLVNMIRTREEALHTFKVNKATGARMPISPEGRKWVNKQHQGAAMKTFVGGMQHALSLGMDEVDATEFGLMTVFGEASKSGMDGGMIPDDYVQFLMGQVTSSGPSELIKRQAALYVERLSYIDAEAFLDVPQSARTVAAMIRQRVPADEINRLIQQGPVVSKDIKDQYEKQLDDLLRDGAVRPRVNTIVAKSAGIRLKVKDVIPLGGFIPDSLFNGTIEIEDVSDEAFLEDRTLSGRFEGDGNRFSNFVQSFVDGWFLDKAETPEVTDQFYAEAISLARSLTRDYGVETSTAIDLAVSNLISGQDTGWSVVYQHPQMPMIMKNQPQRILGMSDVASRMIITRSLLDARLIDADFQKEENIRNVNDIVGKVRWQYSPDAYGRDAWQLFVPPGVGRSDWPGGYIRNPREDGSLSNTRYFDLSDFAGAQHVTDPVFAEFGFEVSDDGFLEYIYGKGAEAVKEMKSELFDLNPPGNMGSLVPGSELN